MGFNAAFTASGLGAGLKAVERGGQERAVIDNFALFVSHGLLLLACWRLLFRDDLDVEEPEADPVKGEPGDA